MATPDAAAPRPDPVRRRTPPHRRLVRLLPVRVRQYWRLLATCTVFLTVLTVFFGTERIRPYVTSDSDVSGTGATVNISGGRDLFDAAVAHTLKLTFRDADYQRMLDAFFADGEKEYVEADLTVDGTTVPSVGIRLKGNSTLMGLTRNGQAGQSGPAGAGRRVGGDPPGGALPDGAQRGGFPGGQVPDGQVPNGAAQGGAAQDGAAQDGAAQGGAAQGGAAQGGGRMGGFGRSSLVAEKPESLPWLISFDEFVDGRRYQGHQEIAVRVAGQGGGSTALNEALALELLAAAGEATQRYAYTSFTVNDRPGTVRLLVEHPDEHFADQFDGPGVLYKALSTSQFTDQGDDPTEYQDDFDQITMKGSQDLQPVINLIRWVNTASDTEFDTHLADHVDVPSFARYVAMQNLLLNFDDMAGPGRNYYLWYDLTSKKFSVIAWDHNLALSGNAEQGPHDAGRMGGGFPGGRQGDAATAPDETTPDGTTPDAAAPDGGTAPGAGTERRGGFRGGGMMSGHKLKERFLASKAFTDVYEDTYRDLYRTLFAGGTALTALDGITTTLSGADGVDTQAVTSEATQLRTLVQQRTDALAKNEIITAG